MSLKIKNVISFKLLFFLIHEILNQTNEIVYLPFESYQKELGSYDGNLAHNLRERGLYSKMYAGEPSCEIITAISTSHHYFALTPTHFANKDIILNSKYDFKKSKSFRNISCQNDYFIESIEDIKAAETFKIKIYNFKTKKYNEKILKDMNIIVGINKQYINNSYYANLGLELITKKGKYKDDNNYNFINQLKSRDIIDDYYLSFIFDKGKNNNGKNLYNINDLYNTTGKIVIGDLTNYFQQNNNYSRTQLVSIYSYNKNSTISNWAIEFNNIFYFQDNNKKKNDYYKVVFFEMNNFLIEAPKSYKYSIVSDFFNYYIKKGICHLNEDFDAETYYCDKSKDFSIENLKEFPSLYFQSNELQYTFELTYEDLFIENDGKFYFLICFNTFNELNEWYIGNLFLRKYNLLFNYDSKIISFYNPNIASDNDDIPEGNEKSNDGSNSIIVKICITFIIFLSVLSIGLGIYIGKIFIYKKKAKNRLNEINDIFEYEANDNMVNEEVEKGSQPI